MALRLYTLRASKPVDELGENRESSPRFFYLLRNLCSEIAILMAPAANS